MEHVKCHRKSQGIFTRKTEDLENGFHTESSEERDLYGLAKRQPGDVTTAVLHALNYLLKKMATRGAARPQGTAVPCTQVLPTPAGECLILP